MRVLATLVAFLSLFASFVFSLTINATNLGVPGVDCAYDYIIIGGGTSGLTIAARLAENFPLLSVAVVEAGGFYEIDNGAGSIIPGLGAAQNTGTSPNDTSPIDWNFVTTPQTGAANRVVRYARGKTLGGSSGRNFMVYHRGTKGSYQKWADSVGDSSYTWDNLLPYFKRSCSLTAPNYSPGKRNINGTVSYNASAFDNSLGGPLHVSWPNWASPLSSWIVQGLAAIGIGPTSDINSGYLNGSSWASTTIDPTAETRDSSETSFLDSVIATTSIKVYQDSMAKKILFKSSTSKVANGVLINTSGVISNLTARKEIILSAGTFQSPQLLMVSGIGPRATLQHLGIPVVKDLPGVGQNMWDHVMFGSVYPVGVTTATALVTNISVEVQAVADYLVQEGALTAPGFGTLAWEKLPPSSRSALSESTLAALNEFPPDWPEVEYLGLDGILGNWSSASIQNVTDGNNYGTVGAALVAPLSRGNITITSDDSADPPVINPNFLSHPADAEVAVAAFKRARAVWARIADITVGEEYIPGRSVATDEQILQFIRQTVVQVWHAAGTCKMGQANDVMAVVDSTAKVFGVRGLRVVDASVFPLLPPGHPQSNCYMIAEKIADDILSGR
ncbi:GMC oxidoreductase [Lepidopterella palustris CBS 459.81]|uniref:GMC oxidoreductase n=1 Tax=Lepidopterella palustris CBS 459.81 TaxID=1314670 RepID=A0A8E2EDD6_9PEZI|nr:GMC oxidoreductase [Lepidopterella palustris CBS 459.81]